jgi:hypothetical protein
MSAAARLKRIARIAAIGELRVRGCERAFALALSRAADASAQLAHIEGLILTAGPQRPSTAASDLIAAAQLRAMLMPAADEALRRAQAARAARAEAESRLAQAQAQARRLQDIMAAARRNAVREAARRDAEARPDRPGRSMR